MATKGFILVMSGLFLLSDGARTSVKSRIDAKSENAMQIGPEGETWEKNTKYVCTKLLSWFFCLVKHDEAVDEAVPTSKHAKNILSCASKSKMKVCPLKGEALERRHSYYSRVAVSKGCFRVSDVSAAYAVIEVALDENQCEEASKQPEEQQIIQPKLTTTTLSDGARISVKSRIDAKSENAMQIGPEGETWEKNTKYVCTQKVYKDGWLWEHDANFCLVKHDEAVPTSNFTHAADILSCAFSNSKMKVCPLKGEALERRLSYSSRVAVSKGCFRVSDVSAAYAVIEVALDENQCEEASKQPEEQQIIQPKLTTTTTSTTTTITTTTTFLESRSLSLPK